MRARTEVSCPLRRSRGGFTLIEAAAGGIVLVLVLLSSLAVLQSGFTMLDTSRKTTLAGQVLQDEIENLRLMSWSAIGTLPATASLPVDSSTAGYGPDARSFTLRRNITAPSANVQLVTLTVTWRQGTRTLSRSMMAHFSRNGLYDYYYRTPKR
jgi:type II secretory pathway pseudopilin PulG